MTPWILTIALLSTAPGMVTPPWMQKTYAFSSQEECERTLKSGTFTLNNRQAGVQDATALVAYCTPGIAIENQARR